MKDKQTLYIAEEQKNGEALKREDLLSQVTGGMSPLMTSTMMMGGVQGGMTLIQDKMAGAPKQQMIKDAATSGAMGAGMNIAFMKAMSMGQKAPEPQPQSGFFRR